MTITGVDVARAFEIVKRYAEDAMKLSGVPGLAMAVVHTGSSPFAAAYQLGVRTIGGAPVDADTIFQLASVSKPITTTIAAVSGAGAPVWRRPLAAVDPRYLLAGDGVTVEALLGHRSGLPDHAGDLVEDMGYGRLEVLARLAHLPIAKPIAIAPRYYATYAYTNFGFTLGARAAAHAAGGEWEDVAAATLAKLGLRTACVTDDQLRRASNRAELHRRDPSPLEGEDPFPAHPRWFASHRNAYAQAPAGGVAASVSDLSTWMRVHLDAYAQPDNPVRSALRYTHEPYFAGATYGLGWNVNDTGGVVTLGHSGGFALGAATAVSLVPSAQLGIVALTNGQPIGVPEALCRALLIELGLAPSGDPPFVFEHLLRLAADRMMVLYPRPEFDYSKPPVAPTPGRAAFEYVGHYAHAFYGPIAITADAGGAMRVRLGPAGITSLPLTHWTGDTFTYVPPGENGGTRSALAFDTLGTPRIQQLRDEHLFEPYPVGHEIPTKLDAVQVDTWPGVYTVDTRLRMPTTGVIRTFSFFAKTSQPFKVVIYRPTNGWYAVVGESSLVTPAAGEVGEVYCDNLEVAAGDMVGFYRPASGAIGYLLDEPRNDRGHGDLGGPVLFTGADATSATHFQYSSDRRYLLTVHLAWGLRGRTGYAVRNS